MDSYGRVIKLVHMGTTPAPMQCLERRRILTDSVTLLGEF